jgi:ABC-type Fe3+-hydroxamate transport system substrate-binding protein
LILSSSKYFQLPPKRIISVVPSITELLYDLGLDDEVTGITKFCVHPEKWFRSKTRIGGTKKLNITKIKELRPDLIITNKEENTKEEIEELSVEFNVWLTDVSNLKEALMMINDIGELTHKGSEAGTIITRIKTNFSKLRTKNPVRPGHPGPKLQTAYIIWKDPYMTVGGDTFISDMMKYCGLQNVFEENKRYPEIIPEQLSTINCQLVLLSSEPYPFKQKHIDELQQQLPGKKIILVDGEMFSWYGSRLLLAADYFNELLTVIGSLCQ